MLKITWVTPILFASLLIATSDIHAQLLISPQPLYMGKIPLGSRAKRQLLVFNTGTSNVNLTSIQIQGESSSSFSILNNPGNITLGPLENLVLDIQFEPQSTGTKEAEIIIESNLGKFTNRVHGAGTSIVDGFITFERILGGLDADGASSIAIAADGGFILAGSTILPEEDFTDVLIIKTDKYGEVLWTTTFGGDDNESASAILPTPDGGYLVAATTASFGAGGQDVYIIKIDADGNEQWHKTYGDVLDDRATAMVRAPNGGYLIVGATQKDVTGRDAYVLRIDEQGNKLWSKNYGGNGGEIAHDVQVTRDGNYIIVGSTTSSGAGQFDVYLFKIDDNGNVQWEKTYGGDIWDIGFSVQQTDDNGFVVAGYTTSFGAQARDFYLIKTDEMGNLQWSKVFGGEHNDEAGVVRQTSDGGFLLAGFTVNFFSANKEYSDLYLVKTDAQGNVLWSKNFGGEKSEGASDLLLDDEGGVIIIGTTNSYSKDNDIFWLKLNEMGNITSVGSTPLEPPKTFVLEQNFPNPFNPETRIRYHLPVKSHVKLQIINLKGQVVATLVDEAESPGVHSLVFNAGHLPSGIYFYRIITNKIAETKRMLLIK
ncbi:MAG: choice-of-anchor D domain-containing protein [Calditrichaeota bacterium]|nr:MAG: choice-of-anchor D domain-containing protein [Calditrichota bacterium]